MVQRRQNVAHTPDAVSFARWLQVKPLGPAVLCKCLLRSFARWPIFDAFPRVRPFMIPSAEIEAAGAAVDIKNERMAKFRAENSNGSPLLARRVAQLCLIS
jgi:hypothetical protein